MQFPEKISREDYDLISKRALRLFLSVDIVNSTALKQEYREKDESWIAMAHRFFTRFPNLLSAGLAWISFSRENSRNPGFELWKAIGDELVFVAEIEKMSDIPFFIEGFRDAINEWNEESESSEVLVKGTAWLAGFPVMNSVMPGDSASHFDYLGSSIDIGFRLGKFASPRKFILSIELAYVLATLDSELAGKFRYAGKEVLKGVLTNRPYPIFWLDCFDLPVEAASEPSIAKLARLEDDLTGDNQKEFDQKKITAFLDAWIDSTNGEIMKPFCPDEESNDFRIPTDYEEKREAALAELEREFLEEGDIGLDDGRDDDLNDFRDSIEKM